MSDRRKVFPLLLIILSVVLLACFSALSEGIPEDYRLAAQSSRFNLYLREDTLAIIVESRENGSLLYSTVQNPDDVKDNATWKGFYQSGVVMEYIEDVKSTNSQADFLNNQSEIRVTSLEDGFQAEVYFPEIGIGYTLSVILSEEGLTCSIPQASIREDNSHFTCAAFYLYPFLGYSYLGGDDGYMIIPDGQGALVSLEDNEGRYTSPFDRPVYGTPIGVEDTVNSKWTIGTEPIIMPVFGMVHTTDRIGFLGVIEEGDCAARIVCYPNGVRTSFDWVAAKYVYRRVFAQPTGPSSGTISMLTEHARTFDIIQHFLLRDGEEASYAGLAVAWRDYMEAHGFFDEAEKSRPFDVELDFLGLEKENFVLGKTDVIMTTFSDAEAMLKELKSDGVNAASVVYRGWLGGGLSGGVPTDSAVPASSLGGASALTSLTETAASLGYDFALEADFLSLNPDTHPSLTYSAFKKITSETWSRQTFGTVYPTLQYMTPDKSLEMAGNVLPAMVKAGISGTSLRGITSLMSDYYYRYAYQDASVLMEVYTELVRTAAASMRTTLQAANCYLWPYAHALSDMPVSGSSYTYVDREVPLLAIALSGRMPLYAEYVNFQANNRRFFLQMVEQGARPCFLLTHADPILLQNSNSSDIYSSAYALYRETISSWYTELSALHDALGASSIVSHETDGDLTKVTWDNGTVVCLNFSDEPAQMDGMNIEGLSYKVVK